MNVPPAILEIRKSKSRQYLYLLIPVIIIISYFSKPVKGKPVYTITFTVIFVLILLGVFLYYVNELIKRKAEITLNSEGIALRDIGFFPWKSFKSFSTVHRRYKDYQETELVLHFNDSTDLKVKIDELEIDKDDLIASILFYKGDANLSYADHQDY